MEHAKGGQTWPRKRKRRQDRNSHWISTRRELARILGNAGRAHESRHWCRLAAARYDELVTSHPEAFADHAAEFWLAAGANPEKALRFARMNVDIRKTPRAYGDLVWVFEELEPEDKKLAGLRQRMWFYAQAGGSGIPVK